MAAGKIRVGTSGYSYADWAGTFYPKGMKQTEFLSYYSTVFDVCEINYTYYRMPDQGTVSSLLEKSDGRVDFAFKLHQSMTHGKGDVVDAARSFVAGIEPALASGKVLAILAQFPNSFRPDRESWERLDALAGSVGEVAPLVVEFRSSHWFRARFFERLRRMSVGFCCVDEPRGEGLIPPVAMATSEVAYVRLHGRNRAKWWKHDKAEERYDYLYSEEDIEDWAAKTEQLAQTVDEVLVFFNNHPRGQAASNAVQMKRLLGI